MLKKKLINLIDQTDLSITDLQIDQLVDYVEMLNKWNKAYNLTAVRDPKEMLIKHIMDSLVVSPYLIGKSFIDVGTGPGLPGIPLAIINPDKQFDLVDSLGKRIRFLKQVQFELKLKNINPVQNRIEEYIDKKFDGVISRAFASLQDMLSWCKHLPNQQGAFYALKGSDIDVIPEGFILKQNIKLTVPELDAERSLVIIQ
ncbi:16S rRNA (guanine(527)-N(7))-methyltransferase RsmG [Gilliamella sp. B2776]|uniref:16S rRNA (guanine(527)-N(7))-methyltransferase RsmG n=1 Tax=unclassified Gilliamella TaxID=2685620 RepID=UPI00226A3C88|nr:MULTISPECIES: 16S rRNA (guanine(527)-N(7))-methyltransferase RsmG [unclassified Gilliamella]MCX8650218.1 16S rRNA (guanine(527)-N(7))-methyltransferase RsmG [Gilliamella sp. B2779]MCX8653435.1 16S rRNA (guanine(527)-N(7))-methyltransferase RsmG [Gilliamella sp. B2737]MCX8656290.1 16S rRNA (guanine(527)-N(7))-methyltransferase RsmG [Gilliamella sp. B2894]MCX8665133.1 16S rRNA (guanine(527)-N(7))-methyltransferase RsmG [Gilliamella sp. B2887]MCX8691911.1 16S rRNA (guanine(527)-N(7))-methyltra